jgi:hypothetical protein
LDRIANQAIGEVVLVERSVHLSSVIAAGAAKQRRAGIHPRRRLRNGSRIAAARFPGRFWGGCERFKSPPQQLLQQARLDLGVGPAQHGAGRDFARVGDDAGAARGHQPERLAARRNDEIAGDDRVRRPNIDAGLVQRVPIARKAHMRQHSSAFLGKASEVEHARGGAIEMRRRGDERADRHDAGAADARDRELVGFALERARRLG